LNKNIKIFGERCSGTNYLEMLLVSNLKNINISREYGSKHQFRRKALEIGLSKNDYFIVIHRNAYDWIRSLHKDPHHAPELLYLPFSKFIRSPWRTYLGQNWKKIILNEESKKMITESYENVIELRKSKMKYFLSFPDNSNLVHLNYEQLLSDPYKKLKEIAIKFNLEIGEEFTEVNTYKKTNKKFSGSHYSMISKKDLTFINQQLDWSVENKLGYNQEDYESSLFSHTINLIKIKIPKFFIRIMR